MRLSQFWIAVTDEFGDYGRVLTRDLALPEFGGLTAEQAIAAGHPPKSVWLALARAADVPENRWHGVGQREPRK